MSDIKPKLKYRIDIIDFKSEEEVVDTIRTILKLSRNQEFLQQIFWDKGEKVKVKISPSITFIVSGCGS